MEVWAKGHVRFGVEGYCRAKNTWMFYLEGKIDDHISYLC